MLSMAVATGASCQAYAKGVDKGDAEMPPRPPSAAGVDATSYATNVASVADAAGALAYSRNAESQAPGREWQMEMLPPETEYSFDNSYGLEKPARMGVAFRLPL